MTEDDVELHQISNGEAYEDERTNVDVKDDQDFEIENITDKQAMDAAVTLKKFVIQNGDEKMVETSINIESKILNALCTKRTKQTLITNYVI